LALVAIWIAPQRVSGSSSGKKPLRAEQDSGSERIHVYRADGKEPVLTENARRDTRPYIHPIIAPDGHGVMTEYRPSHHPHQTGIYWGFKLLNGREFFMQWQGDHYRKVSSRVVQGKGLKVKWQTVYDMLDESGTSILEETQNWSVEDTGSKYILDLDWHGVAKTDVVLGKTYVGGLFLRLPWRPTDRAEAVNSAGQRDSEAEQQRAIWTDMGIQVEGRNDLGHIAVLDHPYNKGFPTTWRVDKQYGFGPNTESSDVRVPKGQEREYRYRLIVYGGELNPAELNREWKQFAKAY
jgi:hypothetical protein